MRQTSIGSPLSRKQQALDVAARIKQEMTKLLKDNECGGSAAVAWLRSVLSDFASLMHEHSDVPIYGKMLRMVIRNIREMKDDLAPFVHISNFLDVDIPVHLLAELAEALNINEIKETVEETNGEQN